ncbi:hypothetical protein TREPR_3369 [Treponema primitia ZAS-2]|uniref:Uncharacterized protein n=1 Tax=Treponema primitia (strain ATCC BAA-887 / DSM 12427 / ZAS-2) TaxID=545694 RepID=F5YK49_TREPZ|nr:hypothetical protein [Treponema primitia]AEF85230.1 hypothetical protein TREPR_3369 [Treponema primitia ZAS-2]
MKGFTTTLIILAISEGLWGCVSLVETGGRLMDGSAFAAKPLGVYRQRPKSGIRLDRMRRKDGSEFIAISLDAMPNLRINGSLPDENGAFYLVSLDFLNPNALGWNEFTQGLSGSGSFVITGEKGKEGTLQLREPVESLDIMEGKIHRGGNRLSGAQALTALHNRQERIAALTEWMKEREPDSDAGDLEAFEDHWKPLLFPELVPKKQRPAEWDSENPLWTLGEDVRWNGGYTRAVFPEELWPVRDSGTLLRDWEEAAGWIYLEFEWDSIVASLTEKVVLKKTK